MSLKDKVMWNWAKENQVKLEDAFDELYPITLGIGERDTMSDQELEEAYHCLVKDQFNQFLEMQRT